MKHQSSQRKSKSLNWWHEFLLAIPVLTLLCRGSGDFLTDPDYTVGLTPDEAAQYFQKNGKSATTALLRKWLECEAFRRPGRKRGAKLHASTLHVHLKKLSLLFTRAQNPMDEGIRNGLHVWIDVSLVPRGLLSTEIQLKQTAMPADLALLRETLFQTDYLSTFADCRSPLQSQCFFPLSSTARVELESSLPHPARKVTPASI